MAIATLTAAPTVHTRSVPVASTGKVCILCHSEAYNAQLVIDAEASVARMLMRPSMARSRLGSATGEAGVGLFRFRSQQVWIWNS